MKHKRESITVNCDCCNVIIPTLTFKFNDGKYNENYVTVQGYDLCPACAMDLLHKIGSSIPKDDIDSTINYNQARILGDNTHYL